MTDATKVPVAVIDVGGQPHMRDAKGALLPVELVKPEHALEDDVVRAAIYFAKELSAEIGRFRGHTMTDLGVFDALLAEKYGAKKGGAKGNRTYQSYDGCLKITVQVADFIDFGPQLQIAKSLVDECLIEWAAGSRPEIRAVITNAFSTDKEGKINRTEIFRLLRLESGSDPRWSKAMDAIRDAMRITGSKEYLRFYERDKPTDGWRPITIDLAKTAPTITTEKD
ncbi:MAG: DUF3164 family protein [Rhodobacteraceae bacterium]|nr:DUF3164 family protein [Paracoccaceae bacterium]